MKWFLVIYMFSTDDLLVTEFNTKKECQIVQKEFKQKIKNKDVKKITCEYGNVMDEYTPQNGEKSEVF